MFFYILPQLKKILWKGVKYLHRTITLKIPCTRYQFVKNYHNLWVSLRAQNLQYRRPWFNSWIGKICWRRNRLPSPVFFGFLCGSAGKESACNVGDLGSVPRLERCPGEGKGYHDLQKKAISSIYEDGK